MSHPLRFALAPLTGWLLLLAGCHDPLGSRSVGDGIDRPNGRLDASNSPEDASSGDAAAQDAAVHADATATDGFTDPFADGALPFDASELDGSESDDDGGAAGPDTLDPTGCSFSNNDVFERAVPFVEGGFALAPGTVGFGLAYRADATCRDAIAAMPVPAFGPFATPEVVVDQCRAIRDLSLIKAQSGYDLVYADNSTDRVELHSLKLDDDLLLASEATSAAITDDPQFERRPVLAAMPEHSLLAWFSEDATTRTLWTKVLGSDAAPRTVVPASAQRFPIELAIAPTGPEHAALAWVEEVAERGVWLQALDATGRAIGGPQLLTDYAAPGSTVDVATRDNDGGAALYSVGIDLVNFEVRFRRLHPDATLRDQEVKIIGRPLQGKDAGFARVGGGYAVVYRAIPDGTVISQAEIRLAFISREGNVTRDRHGRVVTFPVVPASRDGSRLQVSLSNDGQLLVAFVDGNSSGHNTLRLIRIRLDCAYQR